MAKITRPNKNIKAFGSSATGTSRTIFGSTTQSDDLDDNLSAEFFEGWNTLGIKPPRQWENGAKFTMSQLISYLFQKGIPEWNGEQEYHENSITNRNGEVYTCLTNDHTSSIPPENDNTNWVGETREKNITVTVGSGGDYSTINEALTFLSNKYPRHKIGGVTATINLLSGFIMKEQVLVYGLDLGWITITSDDAVVTIENAYLVNNFTTADYGFDSFPLFGVSKGGSLPRVGALFQFDVSGVGGNKHGVMAVGAGSSADILAGCGVKNAGVNGISTYSGSTVNAVSADVSGAGGNGVFAVDSSTVNANGINVSGASNFGIYSYLSSTVNASGADATGAGVFGIATQLGSTVNANQAMGTLSQTKNTVTYQGIIFQI